MNAQNYLLVRVKRADCDGVSQVAALAMTSILTNQPLVNTVAAAFKGLKYQSTVSLI